MVGLYKWFSTSNRRVSVRTSWTASLPQAQRCWVIQMGSIEQMKKTSEKRKKERKEKKGDKCIWNAMLRSNPLKRRDLKKEDLHCVTCIL